MVRVSVGLLALLVATAPLRAATDEGLSVPVRYRDDKVSLRVDNMPVGDVLKEIGRKSGAEIKGELREPHSISGEFDEVPLREALPRLLGAQNFTLTYGEDGKLKAIELLGGPLAPPEKRKKETVAKGKDYDPRWITVWRTFEHRRPIPVSGKLAALTGKSELNWDYLVNTAYGYEEDARVRNQAIRLGLKALEEDPELRAAALESTAAMSDTELAEFARTMCRHRAQDFVKRVARLSDRPEIRNRAVAVLRELRHQEQQQTAGR